MAGFGTSLAPRAATGGETDRLIENNCQTAVCLQASLAPGLCKQHLVFHRAHAPCLHDMHCSAATLQRLSRAIQLRPCLLAGPHTGWGRGGGRGRAHLLGHLGPLLVVAAHRVGQPRVGVAEHPAVRARAQVGHVPGRQPRSGAAARHTDDRPKSPRAARATTGAAQLAVAESESRKALKSALLCRDSSCPELCSQGVLALHRAARPRSMSLAPLRATGCLAAGARCCAGCLILPCCGGLHVSAWVAWRAQSSAAGRGALVHVPRAQRTVQAHREGLHVRDADPEGLVGLPAQRAPAHVHDRARHLHGVRSGHALTGLGLGSARPQILPIVQGERGTGGLQTGKAGLAALLLALQSGRERLRVPVLQLVCTQQVGQRRAG